MKKVLLGFVVLILAVSFTTPMNAQGKMAWGVAGDLMLPIGDFSNAVKMGFGGDGRFQYDLTPMAALHGTVGYFTWSGKDITDPFTGATASGPSFKGFMIRVGGKYYFMPAGKLRVYGLAEIGLFFSSTEAPTIQTPFGTIGGGSVSNTNFTYAPALGVEIPAGKINVDLSVRYDGIATSGSTTSNIGFRAGVNFPIGG